MATDFELIVLKELGEIKGMGAATAARLDEFISNAEIENKQCFQDRAQLNEKIGGLAGMQSDIAEIKADRKDDKKWERIHNVAHYSLTPILVLAHGIARHFGIDV